MIASLIDWSLKNRFLVLMVTALAVAAGCMPLSPRRWMRYRICPTHR